jgi:acyl-CoA synthetase (AMP-forming)/AMP-acid ligase II
MFISGGENVYPAEVERVLREHPDIEDSAVIGVPDDFWGESGHAFIICRPGADVTKDGILDFCSGTLAKYKLPRRITFCRTLPRTPLGKIRKFLLHQSASGLSQWPHEKE